MNSVEKDYIIQRCEFTLFIQPKIWSIEGWITSFENLLNFQFTFLRQAENTSSKPTDGIHFATKIFMSTDIQGANLHFRSSKFNQDFILWARPLANRYIRFESQCSILEMWVLTLTSFDPSSGSGPDWFREPGGDWDAGEGQIQSRRLSCVAYVTNQTDFIAFSSISR